MRARLAICVAMILFLLGATSASAQGPVATFDWRMPDRFGAKLANGMVDFHWNVATAQYERTFVRPAWWRVELDACASRGGTTFAWEIDRSVVPPTRDCKLAYQVPKLGTYPVKLTVKDGSGRAASIARNVIVKDWLIVSIGDSYASGEGNPDIHQKWSGPTISSGPKWVDRRCHRSAFAGPAKAALEIEQRDPRTSVTFLSFACSGATVWKGLIGSYAGVEPEGHDELLPQLDQVVTAVGDRQIDALVISIGGNDIGFADIARTCIINDAEAATDLAKKICRDTDLSAHVSAKIGDLATVYDNLEHGIRKRNLRVANVFITEYPDPTHADSGDTCGMHSGRRLLLTVHHRSADWARDDVLGKLNQAIKDAAAKHGWVYVGGIAWQFSTHGECASDGRRWFRTEEDARNIQGPIDWSIAKHVMVSKGTLHPNGAGHEIYARRIIDAFDRAGNPKLNIIPAKEERGLR